MMMMKRIVLIIVAVAMLFPMCAAGGRKILSDISGVWEFH